MAKHPWFKLYAGDYLVDEKVDEMPPEGVGLLLGMWCICHLAGSCPADPEALARKTKLPLPYVRQYLQHCSPFFELTGGKFISQRMEEEKQLSEKQRKNANERWRKTKPPKSESGSKSVSERGNASGIASGIATSAQPPSIAEVAQYCAERANDIDPQRFLNYYESKGWMVGNSPMRDWKAALRTWETNGVNYANGNGNGNLETLNRAFPKMAS